MNLFAIFAIGNGSTFKIVHGRYNFKILDYLFLRCISLTIVSVILIYVMRIEVMKLPDSRSRSEWVKLLVLRSLAGHACFMTFQYSFIFAPVSLLALIFQTNPFFTSILAYFVNGEVIQRFELVGMILCFLGICLLGNAVKNKQDPTVMNAGLEGTQLVGVAIMTVSAMTFAVQCVFTRKLKDLHFT